MLTLHLAKFISTILEKEILSINTKDGEGKRAVLKRFVALNVTFVRVSKFDTVKVKFRQEQRGRHLEGLFQLALCYWTCASLHWRGRRLDAPFIHLFV